MAEPLIGDGPGISAFFPCYNDGGTIASMVTLADLSLRRLTSDYEILVVDDSSSDASRPILVELERKYSNLKVIWHERNRGYGGALKSGFRSARKEWVFYTDGDFQYDVSQLPLLLDAAHEGIDVVNGFKVNRGDPFYRKIIGRIYHWIVKLMFGLKIRDVDCDFRLIRRSALAKVELKYDSGVICVELVKKLQNAGCVFTEVPVRHFFRSYGKSQFFNFVRLVRVGRDLLKLWWELVANPRDVRNHA